jgi:uncharacterized protein YceK
MKRIAIHSLATVLGIAIGILLSGCASTRMKHLDAQEFVERAKVIEQMNSAMWMTYVGSSHSRAYLEFQDMLTLSGNPATVVYWTELDGLPKQLADQLKTGTPPWTPWQLKFKEEERTIGSTVP